MMLTRTPNIYLQYAAELEAVIAAAPIAEPHWPPLISKHTLKSRRQRAQAKENKRDPIFHFNTAMKRSEYNEMLQTYEREFPLEARSLSLDENTWRDTVGKVIIPTLLRRKMPPKK